jgi:hypothetical protein
MIIFCRKIRISLIFLFVLGSFVYAEDTVVATNEVFPQWVHNLRRTEIITFGSLPFVTLSTTLCYSLFRYYNTGFDSAYIPNPMAKTSDAANLDSPEQMMLMKYSIGISIGIGISDLIFNLIKQRQETVRNSQSYTTISVTPARKNTGNILPPGKDAETQKTSLPIPKSVDRNTDYLIRGIESAVF